MYKSLVSFAATAIALGAAPNVAAAAAEPSIRVEYKDLDLSTKAGRAALDRRIANAANAFCPAPATTGTLIRRDNVCYDDVVKAVREQLAAKGVGTDVASR